MTRANAAFEVDDGEEWVDERSERRRPRAPQRLKTPEPFLAVRVDITPASVEPEAAGETADWRQLVAAQFSREFSGLSEDLFIALAERAPAALAVLLANDGLLDSAELTLAAEAMGRAEDPSIVRRSLFPLLRHSSAVVREGAMYGLASLDAPDIRLAIETLARKDMHPGVRRAAGAVLEGWIAEQPV